MYTLDRNPHYPRKYCLQPTIPNRANNDRTNRKSPGALTTPNRRFKTMRIIHRTNRKNSRRAHYANRDSMSPDSDNITAFPIRERCFADASIGSLFW